MDAIHTEGPWRTTGESDHGDYFRVRGTLLGRTFKIADCPFLAASLSGKEEAEANARLIAAAPELLKALMGMLESFDVLDDLLVTAMNNPTMQGVLRGAFLTEPSQARAAIAKALGKEGK